MTFGNAAKSARDHDNVVWTPSGRASPKAHFTRDRGATWSAGLLRRATAGDFLHPAQYLKRKTLAADPLVAGSFYAVGGNDQTGDSTLWKTLDGGAVWNRVTSTTGPGRRGYWDFRFNSRLVALPGRSGHLLALPGVTDSGNHPYWRTTDGGRSWTEQIVLRERARHRHRRAPGCRRQSHAVRLREGAASAGSTAPPTSVRRGPSSPRTPSADTRALLLSSATRRCPARCRSASSAAASSRVDSPAHRRSSLRRPGRCPGLQWHRRDRPGAGPPRRRRSPAPLSGSRG